MAFYVYRVGIKNQIDSIFKHGYSRQFLGDNEGTDYGDGVYCNIRISDALTRYRNTPNACLLKCEILGGLSRYLIFYGELAEKVHGSQNLKDQVYKLFGEDADKVWRDFTNIMKNDPDARQHMHGRTAELLQVLLSPRRINKLKGLVPQSDRNRNFRKEYEFLFKKHGIQGAIYQGIKDGLCVVVYDFGTCIPVEYSVDAGRTWHRKKYEGVKVDVIKRYGLKYTSIEHPIKVDIGDGSEVAFSKVRKKNGKYNYLEVYSGEEISPIDFDSVTLLNPNNGEFSLEYNGEHFDACLAGFYDSNDEGHDFSELPKLAPNNPKFKYGEYDLPTEKDLDSNRSNVFTIYHVTKKTSVDGIFQNGFDREFTGQQGNCYGEGVYTTISKSDARQLLGSHYGQAIIEGKIIGGIDKFIILDRNLAQKYYGPKYDLLSQLKTFLPPQTAEAIYMKCGSDVKRYSKIAAQYGIRGAIYPWGGVTAILPFDFSAIIPYALSLDGGRTFTKKLTQDTLDRFASSVDVGFALKNKYKKAWKSIKGKDENGLITGYCLIQKHNNKYNYLDIQKQKEISPIDFDSASLMTCLDKRGLNNFQLEYKGRWFKACQFGFYDEDMELHDFNELPRVWDIMENLPEDDEDVTW